MLQKLCIGNVALIERLDMEFAEGFNVLTGETGAGKSIVIDAVNLALGERGSRELIKHGAEKARVEALFTEVRDPRIDSILEENGITPEEELIISRELSAAGKNVCRLNGTLITLGFLKRITDLLVDVHGQHEHQALLDPRTHIDFLDACAPNEIVAAKARVQEAATSYHELLLENRLETMPEAERIREIDLLRYEIAEIEAAKLYPDEEEELGRERALLMNAEKIMEVMEQSYALLHEEQGGLQLVGSAVQSLGNIAGYAKEYADMHAKLTDGYYILEDAAAQLRDCKDAFVFDAQRLAQIEARLDTLAGLKRKYGKDIPEILAFLEQAGLRLNDLVNAAEKRAELQKRMDACVETYRVAADKLGALRRTAAQDLREQLLAQLAQLGMTKADFCVQFAPQDTLRIAENGEDEPEFLLSANPGEPLKPLSKVASGGELSRIMLAFKSIYADRDAVPTLIFDEIDTGISGKMASVVGEKMVGIAKGHQVICVTHLPQIAAFADVHYLVEKSDDGNVTTTAVRQLDEAGCIVRLAAMMSGDADSAFAKDHARELLAAMQAEKQKLRAKGK